MSRTIEKAPREGWLRRLGTKKRVGIVGLVAATATAIAWYSGFGLSIHDFEHKKLSQLLNERGIFPDWKGPAPIYVFYKGRGYSCEIYAGVGGEKEFMSFGNFLYDGPIDWTATARPVVTFMDGSINGCPDKGRGRDSMLVIYRPLEKKYKAFAWTNNKISHIDLSKGTPMDRDALTGKTVGIIDLTRNGFPDQLDLYFNGMFTEVVIPRGELSKDGRVVKSWLLDKNRALGIAKDKEQIAKVQAKYE